MNYGLNAKHMVLAVTNCYPSKAMQMQWLNILASIFQKHLGSRKDEDKGKRLIASSSGWTKTAFVFLGLTTIPFCGVLTLPFSPEN